MTGDLCHWCVVAAHNAVGTWMWKRPGESSFLCLGSGIHFASRLPHGLGRAIWKVLGDWLHLEASGYPGNADPCKRLKSRQVFEALYGYATLAGHVLLDVS